MTHIATRQGHMTYTTRARSHDTHSNKARSHDTHSNRARSHDTHSNKARSHDTHSNKARLVVRHLCIVKPFTKLSIVCRLDYPYNLYVHGRVSSIFSGSYFRFVA